MGKRRRKGPRIIAQDGPTQAVIGMPGLRPERPANLADSYRREGAREIESKVDAAIDQVRADAQALETAAKILDDAPRNIFPVPHKAETVAALFSLAAGMRLAADRMPDSREVPF